MTDKERLEEIKNVYEDYKGLQKKRDFKQADIALLYLSENHIDWLIQQVEESAKERAEWEIEARTQYAINKRLKKEIKQYRQALREIKNTDTTKEVYRLWAEQALKGEYRK